MDEHPRDIADLTVAVQPNSLEKKKEERKEEKKTEKEGRLFSTPHHFIAKTLIETGPLHYILLDAILAIL